MKDVMGIIYTGEKDSFLRELTLQRAIAAVPVVRYAKRSNPAADYGQLWKEIKQRLSEKEDEK